MVDDSTLSPTEKLLYLGRVAWSEVSPRALARLSTATEHLRERAYPLGSVLAREGEPLSSAYLLVRGRVEVSRRGAVLGDAKPGSIIGLDGLLSQDNLGIGVVAATDVLALEVESDAVLGILGDSFPLVYDMIRTATRRRLALTYGLPPRDESSNLLFRPPPGRQMNLVERLLLLRTPGGPFERSSIDTLAELAGTLVQVRFEAGHVLWRRGERAGRSGLIVEGTVACRYPKDGQSCCSRVGAGRTLGDLESIAGEARWCDAIAETPGCVLEGDVESLIDMFEDDVDVALDYLAWVSRTTLNTIETAMGPSRELLGFFTTFSADSGYGEHLR